MRKIQTIAMMMLNIDDQRKKANVSSFQNCWVKRSFDRVWLLKLIKLIRQITMKLLVLYAICTLVDFENVFPKAVTCWKNKYASFNFSSLWETCSNRTNMSMLLDCTSILVQYFYLSVCSSKDILFKYKRPEGER